MEITRSRLDFPMSPSTQTVLFAFDDHSIPFTRNLSLTMVEPERHPSNPVVARGPDGSPDVFGVQFYGSVVRDEGRFKMWYVAVDPDLAAQPHSPQMWRAAYAESEDGIHWTKPLLGLVEYRGSRDNNLVHIAPAPLNMINLKVLVEPEDPHATRRYKMTAHAWWTDGERGGGCTLCPLVSADGLRWRLAIDAVPRAGILPGDRMVLPTHHFEAAGGLYKWDDMYYASGQSNPPQGHDVRGYSGREVVMHRSPDFVHWSETTSVGFLRPHQRTAQFAYSEGEETHEGVSVWNRGNVLLGLYGIWHGAADWADRSIDLGLLISNDGVHFREALTEWTFLERGPDGDWDQGGLIQGQGFENVDDKTYIYYGAWDPRPGLSFQPRGGVGLATLARDRFGYLSVREWSSDTRPSSLSPALVTAPIRLGDPADLRLNADGLNPGAPLIVELLSKRELPIPGFSGDRAGAVREGGFYVPVDWPQSAPAEMLAGPVRLKVTFPVHGSARLYAVYA